jgi:hypothetical protein
VTLIKSQAAFAFCRETCVNDDGMGGWAMGGLSKVPAQGGEAI